MTLVDFIFLISNVLGFITAGLILFKVNTNKIFAVYLLVAYLVLNGISNSFYLLIQYGYIAYVPYLYKIPAPLTFLIGPAAYLYLRATLYSEKRFHKTDWIHFVPFVFFAVNYIPFYFMPLAEKSDLVGRVIQDMSLVYMHQDGLLPEWVNIAVRSVLSIVYIIAQWRLIQTFYKAHPLEGGHFLKIKKWVRSFFNAQMGYWLALLVIYTVNGLANYFGAEFVPEFVPSSTLLIMSIFFFVLSGYLLMSPHIMLGLNMNLSLPNQSKKEGANSYDQVFFDIINEVVQGKNLFLDPNLNLAKVATETKVSQRNIAIAVSDHGFSNFNEYINEYRVRLSIEKLTSKEMENYSIESIAQSCGFNSKATFYRSFKKLLGCTPTEFIKNPRNFKLSK